MLSGYQSSRYSFRNRCMHGSAALEVLLLIPFILLIWMLLFNMAYNGYRHRMAQAALRVGAYEFVSALATTDRAGASRQAADAANSPNIFTNQGQGTAATFQFSSVPGTQNLDTGQTGQIEDDTTDDGRGLLAKASSRETVTVSVTRDPPFVDLVNRRPIEISLIVSTNTWTYCEMKDKDQGVKGLSELDDIGKYGLWLFGGCGGDILECARDRC